MQCKHCGSNLPDGAWICPACGYDQTRTSRYSHRAGLYVDLPNLPMRWYAFLINFILFVYSAVSAVFGIILLLGGTFTLFGEVPTEVIYEECPSMQQLDIAIGCGMLICSLLYLVARFRLAGFCKGSPHLLCITLIVSSSLSIIRLAGMYSLLPEEFLIPQDVTYTIVAFISSMIIVVLNTLYFKKRIPFFSR